jgi:acetylornithine deacetylase/succinyl-diaminopimelate desuccinylase-like protein
VEAIREAVDTMDPGALITHADAGRLHDSYYYRALGIGAYGLDPFRTTVEEDRTVHGNDERVSLENVRFGVEFFYRVVERVAR